MKGTIKFVDRKSGQWGFLIPDDGKGDVHFRLADFLDEQPTPADDGGQVEFTLWEDSTSRHATKAKLLSPSKSATFAKRQNLTPGESLSRWGFIPYNIPVARGPKQYPSAFHLLAELALDERWFFGKHPDSIRPFPILENYLQYTFFRLSKENKVIEKGQWAVFNTGLVDKLYDPIFALFTRNDRSNPPWKFVDFCIPGKGPAGKKLTSEIAPLPEAAKYFSSNFDMLLDTSQEIHVDYEHVIYDGVERDRFPIEFLSRHVPKGFAQKDPNSMTEGERVSYFQAYRQALENDLQCTRAIKNRLEDAKTLAEKRTRWNFKTAIPQYYPKFDVLSLLLPLALVSDELVDIALIVTRNPSGSYQGRTILPLAWAYKNARLVCRPDSDWLTTENINGELAIEEDQDETTDEDSK